MENKHQPWQLVSILQTGNICESEVIIFRSAAPVFKALAGILYCKLFFINIDIGLK